MTTLPNCSRCGQPRSPETVTRGICDICRRHTCRTHQPGTRSCYSECKCRCRRCAHVWYKAESARKHYAVQHGGLRVDATSTQRRIHALYALGWAAEHIAAATTGISSKGVWQISGNRRWLNPETVRTISAAYDRLSMKLGPSTITAARAAARGYVPPLAWDDDDGPHGIDNPNAKPYGRVGINGREAA